jgi:hypothetical protein
VVCTFIVQLRRAAPMAGTQRSLNPI